MVIHSYHVNFASVTAPVMMRGLAFTEAQGFIHFFRMFVSELKRLVNP